MSLRDKDVANIRRAFSRIESIKNFTCQDYHNILDSLERMHANMLLKYCKVRGYNRKETINFFKERHKKMLSLFEQAMDEHHFSMEENE